MCYGENKTGMWDGVLKLFAVLNKVTKEGLIEKIFEQKLRGG